jgi:hypothetical protein
MNTQSDSDLLSIPVAKKAMASRRLSPDDHTKGFELLEPLLVLAKELNPGLLFNLSVAGDTFTEVQVVFPYARDMLTSGYFRPIVGVDIAHMKTVIMSTLPRTMLSKMYLIMFATRSNANQMMLLAFGVSVRSCSDAIKNVHSLMAEAGVDINNEGIIILQDRGTAETAFVDAELPLALKSYCGKHLPRNLTSCGWTQHLQLFCRVRDARSRELHLSDMAIIKNKCLPMYEYLSKATHWQVYEIVDRGLMLFDFKSDNIVEAGFGWLLEARHLSVYYFIRKVLGDGFTRHDAMRNDILSWNKILNFSAHASFEEVVLKERNQPLTCTILDSVAGIAMVHSASQDTWQATTCRVNLSEWKCDKCITWSQKGHPCREAWAVIRCLNRHTTSDFYTTRYFHRSLLAANFQNFFGDVPSLIGKLPSDNEICDYSAGHSARRVLPPIVQDATTPITSKRIRSVGESGTTSAISSKNLKKKTKRPCLACGRVLSENTKHPTTACIAWHNKMNPDNLWKTNNDIAKASDGKGWEVTDVATAWMMDADCVVDDNDDRYHDGAKENEEYLYDDSHGSIAVMRECNAYATYSCIVEY